MFLEGAEMIWAGEKNRRNLSPNSGRTQSWIGLLLRLAPHLLLPALGRDRLFQKRPLQMQLRGDPA